jgi:hypothetical protein
MSNATARQRKSDSSLEPLYSRSELATRWHVTPQHVTRNYQKMGLRPLRVGKRRLFPESQIIAAERRALTGDDAA